MSSVLCTYKLVKFILNNFFMQHRTIILAKYEQGLSGNISGQASASSALSNSFSLLHFFSRQKSISTIQKVRIGLSRIAFHRTLLPSLTTAFKKAFKIFLNVRWAKTSASSFFFLTNQENGTLLRPSPMPLRDTQRRGRIRGPDRHQDVSPETYLPPGSGVLRLFDVQTPETLPKILLCLRVLLQGLRAQVLGRSTARGGSKVHPEPKGSDYRRRNAILFRVSGGLITLKNFAHWISGRFLQLRARTVACFHHGPIRVRGTE